MNHESNLPLFLYLTPLFPSKPFLILTEQYKAVSSSQTISLSPSAVPFFSLR